MNPVNKISVVVPLYNEEGNVKELHTQILNTTNSLPQYEWEIIFVDDGSSDNTVAVAQTLSPLTLVTFRKNYGQTAAFDAGFKQATGDIIITLDGDLQNDPADIPALLAELDKGYDVVSGWRKNRQDKLSKKVTSRTANLLRKALFNDKIHDSGCALKAYRRECFDNLNLFGEMHRFIPALLTQQGFTISEVVVNHRARYQGSSKYGNIVRGIKSMADMLLVSFLGRYSARPLHVFGTLGMLSTLFGVALLVSLFILRVFFDVSLADRIWPIVAVFAITAGIQLFTIGILADMQSKIYYRLHDRMNYSTRSITVK